VSRGRGQGGEDEAGAGVWEREGREEAPEGVLGGEEIFLLLSEPQEKKSGVGRGGMGAYRRG
jgi:hypothetical protein